MYVPVRDTCESQVNADSKGVGDGSVGHASITCSWRVTRCQRHCIMRDAPKVMSNVVLHANWEQQTKESAGADGTSCCVILECLVTSIACIT